MALAAPLAHRLRAFGGRQGDFEFERSAILLPLLCHLLSLHMLQLLRLPS
jgi:hypothetical protein